MSKHKSVLLDECIEYLNLKDDSIVVDCTLGYGGHSSEILKRINEGFLFAFDQDIEAISNSKKRIGKTPILFCCLVTHTGSTKNLLVRARRKLCFRRHSPRGLRLRSIGDSRTGHQH